MAWMPATSRAAAPAILVTTESEMTVLPCSVKSGLVPEGAVGTESPEPPPPVLLRVADSDWLTVPACAD